MVVFDPLDGSSNIDAGISTGSIFGIYAPSEECSVGDMDNPEAMMQNCIINVCQVIMGSANNHDSMPCMVISCPSSSCETTAVHLHCLLLARLAWIHPRVSRALA